MRIAYFAHFAGGTDASSGMDAELFAALRERGHEVIVLAPYRDPDVGRVGGSLAVGRLPRLLLAVPAYLRMAMSGLRHTREPGTHIVGQYHVFHPATAIAFLVARLRGRPLVARVHNLLPGSYRSAAEAAANRVLFRVYRRILRHPWTLVLVSSSEWKDLAVRTLGLREARLLVLPDNVTPPPATDPAAVRGLRESLGLTQARTVLKFGSFTREGNTAFVDGLRLLNRLDTKGVVLADPRWGAALRREAEARGIADRLVVLGTRPRGELPAFLAMADVCVGLLSDHPMARGSLPRNTLEAMAAGKPVVLCDGVAASTLVQDGRNGLLVPPGDAAGLAQALARVLEDPTLAATLGEAARTTIAETFRSDVVARGLESLLSEPFPPTRSHPR